MPWLIVLSLVVAHLLSTPQWSWSEGTPDRDGAERTVVFYTSSGATTPQMPFWAAVAAGWPDNATLETRFWKDLDDLRATVLAGRGDIWLGHVDGLAQAALRGAPVSLVAVTGWRKFYVLSMDDVGGLDELTALLKTRGESLAIAPPDSPALAILDDMARRGAALPGLTRLPPNQLALDVLRGGIRHCLVPEPLVSMLLTRVPGLRVVAGLEKEHARYTGGSGFLPVAGIAVHRDLLRGEPELVRSLVRLMTGAGPMLAADREAALCSLPPEIRRELGDDVIRRSLERDVVRVIPAGECRQEVMDYLSMVLPGAQELPPDFLLDLPCAD